MAQWLRRLFPGEGARWIFLSVIVGIVAGLGAVAFDLMFRAAQWAFLVKIGHFLPPAAGSEGGAGFAPQMPWLLPLSLVLGGLISGALVFGFAPEAEGHGTDAVIDAFHRKRGVIRARVPIVKAISSAITIGSGGSAGREGPIAQIGAGFGSVLADTLKLTNRERRILMMAGVAGGVGGIFRAPLGATFFAAEVLYSSPDFEYEVLIPSLISSITSFSIYSSYAGWSFLFDVPPISFHSPRQLALYAILGILCAFFGAIYPAIFYGARDRLFRKLPFPKWIVPAIGALMLGLIAVLFPQSLGMGYGYIQEAIRGEHTMGFLLAFAAVKMIATSLTISSGGSGGVFGPSLVIGGALGAAFGRAAVDLFPTISPEPAAFIMVGMGGFFAGVAKVPFASVIMVMEMTGSYGLLVPSLLVATIAYLVVPRASRLYENQVPRRLDSPVHQGSFAVEILTTARLKEMWEPCADAIDTVKEDLGFAALLDLAERSPQAVFPVVGASGSLVGEISVEEIRRALTAGVTPQSAVARDLMREAPEPLLLDDDLARVARLLAERTSGEMSVVADASSRRVVGTFSRRDLTLAYGRLLQRLHGHAEKEERLPARKAR
jgi:CIC family chloride channel protein